MEKYNRIFKLTPSGEYKEIIVKDLLDAFNISNILAIYVPTQRKMLVWVGKRAPPNLRKYIHGIRQFFVNNYPEMRILRNITIDSGSEPPEFLEILGINKEDFKDRLEEQEKELIPISSEVNKLIYQAQEFHASGMYMDALKLGKKALNLIKKINDEFLINKVNALIETAKSEITKREFLERIENESKSIKEKVEVLMINNQLGKALNLVTNFLTQFENTEFIKGFQPIIELKALKEDLESKVKESKLEIHDKFNLLKNKILESLKNHYFSKITSLFSEIENLLNNEFGKNLKEEFEELKSSVKDEISTFKNSIKKLTFKALDILKSGNILETLEIYEKVIKELERATIS